MDETPECKSVQGDIQDDARWNTESPDMNGDLCKGTWWRFWPAINWEITIPNDHIFDKTAIKGNPKACGSSVYRQLPFNALASWIGCDMHQTTGYLQFRVIGSTEVSTVEQAFNRGTCNAFDYVHCYKKKGSW